MRLERWMHRKISDVPSADAILELGAGTLNHVRLEMPASGYDAVEPFRELWEGRPERQLIRAMYEDIEDIPSGTRYGKIVSVAVLEHLTDLPRVIARCGLLLSPGGVFQAGVPTEGGALWGLAWRVTTALAFRLTRGLDYSRIMRHEHLNSAQEIEAIVGYCFEEVSLTRFPLPWRHASFYTYLEARRPRTGQCRALLERQAGEGRAT
jgi:SAM-dependent methyltransferase